MQALWLNALAVARRSSARRCERWADLLARAGAASTPPSGRQRAALRRDRRRPRAGHCDASFGPNQILAIGGLPLPLLAGERARWSSRRRRASADPAGPALAGARRARLCAAVPGGAGRARRAPTIRARSGPGCWVRSSRPGARARAAPEAHAARARFVAPLRRIWTTPAWATSRSRRRRRASHAGRLPVPGLVAGRVAPDRDAIARIPLCECHRAGLRGGSDGTHASRHRWRGTCGTLLSHLLHLAGMDASSSRRGRASISRAASAPGCWSTGWWRPSNKRAWASACAGSACRTRARSSCSAAACTGSTFRRSPGGQVMVYSQHEVVRDLVAARLAAGGQLIFEASDVHVEGYQGNSPAISYKTSGTPRKLSCDVIAGCDGFHGVCRPTYNPTAFDRIYPFGWLGILAEAPPSTEELSMSAMTWLRAAGDAFADVEPALSAMCAGRGSRGVVGRSDLGGVADRGGDATVRLAEGPILQRGSRRCAASWPSRCVRAAVPGR